MSLMIDQWAVTEADLLAELHHRCRLVGIILRMEVCLPSSLHRSKRMRVDAVLVMGRRVLALIEGKTPGGKIGGNTRQKHAYAALARDHGIPTFWINSCSQIDGLVLKLKGLTLNRFTAGHTCEAGGICS